MLTMLAYFGLHIGLMSKTSVATVARSFVFLFRPLFTLYGLITELPWLHLLLQ